MLIAILAMTGLAAALGLLLGYSAIRFRVEGNPIADQIDALLPQTQCGQCGHPGCRPYAEALARGEDEINKCVPGGESTLLAIADLLGREPTALEVEEKLPSVAVIDAQTCIGCTLCLQACPVDAIVGAAKQLHGVIAAECTGCELCLPPCPVECIRMVPIATDIPHWRWPYPASEPDSRAASPEREAEAA
ncbi:Electron transport complex protein RnfB [Thiocapsa sp. KS1]|nr:electron transport complex subunit RsxB [Thiocapsa sp. KS1]CRI65436.1 Electron transport complex protein RnfB [Thiocapsa sp. KS1]